ncbi:ATP-dependent helicase HrpB [Mariprofundus erugo]|uniref:ATP-dependent helicase HrpB n=1 Tax=Mariprofundus erugo TaxID=2528639 RepID=A0A5R9GPE7_9PROT|nr:ATP-dependent helicase HrpB [Mariprofundus erugo]TLS66167.1 ATP-dependent helicase HrpB [Mariprofundus erugo]
MSANLSDHLPSLPPDLPIHAVLAEIQQRLTSHNRLVLQAPPGAGKTTAVPLALLGQPWLEDKQIILLEPRRLAARNAAARMAYLLGEKVGETVGYQIRQENCTSAKTRILVVTEGILTRKLQADPELQHTALVMFDEFHERSLHADLSLALSLQSQQILREDLKLLVMSATLNTGAIARLLGDAPIIQSEGRSFPVAVHYLEQAPPRGGSHFEQQQALMGGMMGFVKTVIHEHDGSTLIFLPGVGEINRLASLIREYLKSCSLDNIIVAPLHGSLSKQQQDLAIAPLRDKGMRKIVLATNIAETSLTIEGINCVIDSGLERILDYSPASGMNRLKTQAISQDSAEQRRGRAGRLAAGTCFRLWTAQQHLMKHAMPEILHSDLTSFMLELAHWGGADPEELQWLDKPPRSACEQATELLQGLRALDQSGKITAHGRDILRLGTHPRLAHMMLAAIDTGQPWHACLIASLLTEKDPFLAGSVKSADIHDRLQLLVHGQSSHQRGIDHQQCQRILQTADDFFARLHACSNQNISGGSMKKERPDPHYSGVLLAFAYPDRIARKRPGNDARYLLSNGKGALIPPRLQQHHLHEYIVVANLDERSGEATIYMAADITSDQLQDCFADLIVQTERIEWNESAERVEVKESKRIGTIVLQESMIHHSKNREAIQACLMQAIRNKGLACLNWSERAISLKQRVECIRYHSEHNAILNKQLPPLPDFSDAHLSRTLEVWLQPHLSHENSLKACQKLDMHMLLISQFSWEQQQLIHQLTPEKISVPSGSEVAIDYSDPTQPILAVRLQELFGLQDTPAILNGQCKLMLHLLSPARRPMQITKDLNSFWHSTYHEVKKDLRGKYKKHYWPDDPFTAQATSKTKKQMERQ